MGCRPSDRMGYSMVMSLKEAITVLLWKDRQEVSSEEIDLAIKAIEEAAEDILEKLLEKHRLVWKELIDAKTCKTIEYENIGAGIFRDALSDFFIDILSRQCPLTTSPPSDDEHAICYVRRSLMNRVISLCRGSKQARTITIDNQTIAAKFDDEDEKDNERPISQRFKPMVDYEDLEDEEGLEIDKLLVDIDTANWEDRLKILIMEIGKWISKKAKRKLGDQGYKKLQSDWHTFEKAVWNVARNLRSASYRVDFVRVFGRTFDSIINNREMKEIIRMECKRLGEDIPEENSERFKVIRDRLDQQKSRMIKRLYEQLIEEGMDQSTANRFVDGLMLIEKRD